MDLLFEAAVEAAGELISEGIDAVATSKKDVLTYSFTFSKLSKEKSQDFKEDFVTAKSGQTLFDIANMCDKNVDELVSLNPQIMFINDLKEGERVRLC